MSDKKESKFQSKEGTYYDCVFSKSTNEKIDKIIDSFGLEKDFTDAYHCTLTYSKVKKVTLKTSIGTKQEKGGDYPDFNCKNKVNVIAKIKSFGHFETPEGKNLHLVLDCHWCEKQHRRSIKEGCTFDYDKYTPHVTLMYNCGNFDLDNTKHLWEKFIGETIHIIEERISPLNVNWVEDSKKDKEDSEKIKEDSKEDVSKKESK